ncbi:type I-E CRISPR-associated protein Cas6/Cse3/CasE [Acidiphilium acidophilum]|uniref:type I-E CRISPR-associated protein Cas6/Cse3/CasE n=1 Tax=Acidiphilium acidophilum TaxID=76588 RepID=UPI002E8E686D|nr:type I-E CRISPR-associated protein Cas6/Cse3/CasE [Acidiphilium acidophilum]
MNQLIRARLKRSAPIVSLGRLLLPAQDAARTDAAHRLVWSLFAGDPDRRRDFLWREEAPGQFIIFAPEPPPPSDLFEVEAKEFAPVLAVGDRLRFLLRANATVSKKTKSGDRGRRADVVMAAIHGAPKGERAEARRDAIETAGRAWLARQGDTHGFFLPRPVAVDGYNRLKLPRIGGRPIEIGTLDFEGVLDIADPARFLAALAQGFGRARAFGCGLMLIRRI